MRRGIVFCLACLVAIGAGLAPTPALAQAPSEPGAVPAVMAEQGVDPALDGTRAPAWGTSDFTMFQIGASAFSVKYSSTTWGYMGNGYIYRTGGSGFQFWAPVVLPAGALLDGFRIFYYDNSTSDITVWFTRYYGDTAPQTQDIATWMSSGTPGYTSSYVTVNKTITYQDTAGNEQNFNLLVALPDASSAMAFKGVRFLYYLQVSPAPATATFADVPTSHWAFQFVEALAASGITAGCGGGNFCPDQPLTRAQMAVFLSSALGLHWQGNEGTSF